jgi:hypothetical protein
VLAHHGFEIFYPLQRDILFRFAEINECSRMSTVLRDHHFHGSVAIGLFGLSPLMA